MLRDKNLVPLSHQHQHALALSVAIHRSLQTGGQALEHWQAEINRLYEAEIKLHFQAEETILFPAASSYPELHSLVRRLEQEHGRLRAYVAQASAQTLDAARLEAFANCLTEHIRTEENELFEACQRLMSESELKRLGTQLDEVLGNV